VAVNRVFHRDGQRLELVGGSQSRACAAVQRVTGINVFRTPCLSHAGNLANRDFLRLLGTKQAIPCDVWTDMAGLRDGLTHWSWTSQFQGLPGLFLPGVVTRYPKIRDFFERILDQLT
jgi:hypothetical protein